MSQTDDNRLMAAADADPSVRSMPAEGAAFAEGLAANEAPVGALAESASSAAEPAMERSGVEQSSESAPSAAAPAAPAAAPTAPATAKPAAPATAPADPTAEPAPGASFADAIAQDAKLTLQEALGELYGAHADDASELDATRAASALDDQEHPGETGDDGAIGFSSGAVGLGVDIVEVERMEQVLARSPAFAERVFSPDERAYCDATAVPAVHYALRFAAKEAVVKALGVGFSHGVGVRDIEVKRAAGGKPTLSLTGCAKKIADEQGVREMPLSLSYTHVEAVAIAIAVTDDSVRATEERVDPKEELARKFKETRGILDDL